MKCFRLGLALMAMTVAGIGSAAAKDAVRASSFGWNPTNATKCLQAALDAGARTVIIDRQPSDWIVEPLRPRSNTEIVFEDGVTVRALKGSFRGKYDCLFGLYGVSNVTLRSTGHATLQMEKHDYQSAPGYVRGEWRHTCFIKKSSQVRIADLTMRASGGDGIAINNSTDITLERIDAVDNHRLAMGVVAARNLVVRDCIFRDTKGTAPECGVDLEPNYAGEILQNILFENCTFSGNAHDGMIFHLLKSDEKTAPCSIILRNCRMTDNRLQGTLITLESGAHPPCGGFIRYENCTIANNGQSAVYFIGKSGRGPKVSFSDCTFTMPTDSTEPAVRVAGADVAEGVAGIDFKNVRCELGRGAPFAYSGMAGTGIREVTGEITFTRGGQSVPFDLKALPKRYPIDEELLKTFRPAAIDFEKLRPFDPKVRTVSGALPKFRRHYMFAQYLPQAGTYEVTFNTELLEKVKCNFRVRMKDMAGTDLGFFMITNTVQTYRFTVRSEQVRRFYVNPGLKAIISVQSPYPGQGVRCDDRLNLYAGTHRLYFMMPAGSEEVCVEAHPQEPAEFTLLDPSGKAVEHLPHSNQARVIRHPMAKSAKDEIWSLVVKVDEDAFVRLGAPAFPFFASDPTCGLRMKPAATEE